MPHLENPIVDFMTAEVESITPSTSLADADSKLETLGISALAVVEDDKPIGVLSRTDLLRATVYEAGKALRLPDESVSAHMTSPAVCVDAEGRLSDACRAMLKHGVHRVLVTREGRLSGVLSTRDLMRAAAANRYNLPLSAVAQGSLVKVKSDDTLALATDRLDKAHKQGLVVVDGDWPVGIFDQACAAKARSLDPQARVEEVMNMAILVLPGAMSIGRAAGQALTMNVRRILVNDGISMRIVSGLDFARLADIH